ncbi:LysR family transcriptional regulator [Pelagibius marinus]|uniref:LysR family transcriptional regulator n=1 Tax=Pelagibius marinus TaxID=2762760 RepID=UPI0018733849|nr:LysR family transcriptional regulator [Pelagibius marinus]
MSDAADRIARRLKLPHLRLTLALANTGQISAAARALNMSQPAASRMLAEMERILGAPVCLRGPKGVHLSETGGALAERARRILTELSEAGRDVVEISAGMAGTVYIGAVTAPAINLVVPALQRLKAEHPTLEANVEVGTSDVLVPRLLEGQLDFVIGRVPGHMDLASFDVRPVQGEMVRLLVRHDHPLAGERRVALAALTDFEWVMQPPGTPLRRAMDYSFAIHGLPLPRVSLVSTSILLSLSMVRRSDAVVPVSDETGALLAGTPGLSPAVTLLDLAERIDVSPYAMITRAGRHLSPTASLFYEEIGRLIDDQAEGRVAARQGLAGHSGWQGGYPE